MTTQDSPAAAFFTSKRQWLLILTQCATLRAPETPPRKRKWVKETILAEARKYTTVRDWRANHESSYQGARWLGILQEARAHMVSGRRRSSVGYWDSAIMDGHIERFNAATSLETKNQIFSDHLYQPLRHMIEAVYGKYRFYVGSTDYALCIDSILDHMRTSALAKFDPRRGSSYSFCTTCIKRKAKRETTRAEAIIAEAVSLNTVVNDEGRELADIALDFAISPELERASRWGGRDYLRGLIRFLRANRWDFGPEQEIYDTVLEIVEGSGFDRATASR